MLIEEFEPDVFRQIIEYIHTSCVTLQPRTLLGQARDERSEEFCLIAHSHLPSHLCAVIIKEFSTLLITTAWRSSRRRVSAL